MHTLTNWGKNMHFPPFFLPLSIIFPPYVSFGHIFAPSPLGGGGQTEKYTPMDYSNLKLFLSSHIFLNQDRLS